MLALSMLARGRCEPEYVEKVRPPPAFEIKYDGHRMLMLCTGNQCAS
jgi:hypothetical protein